MPGIAIGKFHVIGPLGTGAHSTILHIRRQADSRSYALKVVPIVGAAETKFLQQAQHEFEVAQKLDHPALIKIYSLEMQRDWLFRIRQVHLLIEHVDGQTLDTFPPIALPRLVQVFERVAAGLAHMHRHAVYHGDLKPNNILLSRTGDVKIIDYGLAWIKGESKDRIQGTPEYMAPETVGQRVVNERTDIYNLGATMYRLVTWRYPPSPVAQDGAMQLSSKAWEHLIKPVKECNPGAPPELCELIHQCLAFDPTRRPGRMKEVKQVLDHVVAELVRAPEDRLEAFRW